MVGNLQNIVNGKIMKIHPENETALRTHSEINGQNDTDYIFRN